ncbi:MAG: signal peptidase [Nitrospirae bacterium RIFCSPLOWO2_02_FULL_62_14]|nr:MAG: signal peptidase [Nitrospirae bacterium RIFCSPLOWO2_02_FULL_62_14]OGW88123.1 MAG: signal peptidase [Nitrospirae bacterium RIFCSPLOWO2_12_FULL_63_8]
MHKRTPTVLGVLGCAALLSGCITVNIPPGPGPLVETQISGSGSSKVLMLDLVGMISSSEEHGFYPLPSQVARLKEALTKAADDPKIQSLVLRINTPGGTVTASDVLYHELRLFKKKKNIPIIASIMDVGASGGYYVAMGADKIVAHPSSVTGSLGVIMLTMNANGLLEKIGVHANAITSGPKKDMGSPFRVMTDEERAIFQSVINSFYERFLTVIKEGRKNLTADEIRRLADGRIYSGEQAKAVGLVDSIGYLDDAVELAKREAGLTEARLVVYQQPGEYRHNIYSQMINRQGNNGGLLSNFDLMALVRGGTPQFMYLWMP